MCPFLPFSGWAGTSVVPFELNIASVYVIFQHLMLDLVTFTVFMCGCCSLRVTLPNPSPKLRPLVLMASVTSEITPESQTSPSKIQKKTATLYMLNIASISVGQIVWILNLNSKVECRTGHHTGLHRADIPVTLEMAEVGTGSTSALKHAVSFRTEFAYLTGGSTIGTISPKPIVDNEIKAWNN